MNTKTTATSLVDYLELSALAARQNRTLDRNLSTVHGIGATEFTVLHTLHKAPRNTLSRIDLAVAIGLSASGVTRLLNPMSKIGLVNKEKNARDARVSLVKLSAAGQRIYSEALNTAIESCDTFFAPLSESQKGSFRKLSKLMT